MARELEILRPEDRLVTGRELDELTDEELARDVDDISAYARVTPEHKLRVVRAWKRRDQVVAMTGDGVNDAPAVQAADIGIAMGLTGTDVTKEASDMVLMDDNFASIIVAVEEGRGILENIRKFVHFLLASNAGELLLMLFAAIVGWPAPLLAIQILWINLVTDGLPALALAMEPPERDILDRAPRGVEVPVISTRRALVIAVHGVLLAAVGAVGFAMTLGESQVELDRAREPLRLRALRSRSFFTPSVVEVRGAPCSRWAIWTNPFSVGSHRSLRAAAAGGCEPAVRALNLQGDDARRGRMGTRLRSVLGAGRRRRDLEARSCSAAAPRGWCAVGGGRRGQSSVCSGADLDSERQWDSGSQVRRGKWQKPCWQEEAE